MSRLRGVAFYVREAKWSASGLYSRAKKYITLFNEWLAPVVKRVSRFINANKKKGLARAAQSRETPDRSEPTGREEIFLIIHDGVRDRRPYAAAQRERMNGAH